MPYSNHRMFRTHVRDIDQSDRFAPRPSAIRTYDYTIKILLMKHSTLLAEHIKPFPPVTLITFLTGNIVQLEGVIWNICCIYSILLGRQKG